MTLILNKYFINLKCYSIVMLVTLFISLPAFAKITTEQTHLFKDNIYIEQHSINSEYYTLKTNNEKDKIEAKLVIKDNNDNIQGNFIYPENLFYIEPTTSCAITDLGKGNYSVSSDKNSCQITINTNVPHQGKLNQLLEIYDNNGILVHQTNFDLKVNESKNDLFSKYLGEDNLYYFTIKDINAPTSFNIEVSTNNEMIENVTMDMVLSIKDQGYLFLDEKYGFKLTNDQCKFSTKGSVITIEFDPEKFDNLKNLLTPDGGFRFYLVGIDGKKIRVYLK